MAQTNERRKNMPPPEPPIAPASTPAFHAAQYVRMYTEHQQYSTHNQADKIQGYADRRNIQIVRTYADEGKSGLSMDGRASLQRLIANVESGNTDFNLILVYDVSRWGQFQDADESAGVLRIHLQTQRHHGRLRRRAVRKRWLTGFDHRQRRQACHGRGVQPGAVGQGVC